MTEDQADAKLREYGLMFSKLMESETFKNLVGLYFTFQKFVNEETKEIEFTVIENPPEVIAQKLAAAQQNTDNKIQVVSGGAAKAVLEKAKRSAAEPGGRRYRDPKRR